MPFADPSPLRREIARLMPSRPFRVDLWDGTSLPCTSGGPAFSLRSPRAIAHVLRSPGQLGLGRAYVAGEIEVDELDAVMRLVRTWQPPVLDRRDRLKLLGAAVRACGLTRPPPVPVTELRPRGRRHTKDRDRRVVRHHYDVSNDFFRLILGDSMTYSCAIFSRGAKTLEDAQKAKNELVCTKLGLTKGERVLDVGCGWGSFAIHAAREHGVQVTGITLSEPQAEGARRAAEAAGVADLVDIRVADYRELGGERFQAIASIGMVEHVGEERIDEYASAVAGLLESGGRLLNHGIARVGHSYPAAGAFSERYVFPDAEPLHLSRVLLALERAGLETRHVEDFRADYAETLNHWVARLDSDLERAIRLAGPERVRVWRLYLRAARYGFETGFTSIYQANARRS